MQNKNAITEIKSSVDRFNSRSETIEDQYTGIQVSKKVRLKDRENTADTYRKAHKQNTGHKDKA